MVATRFWKAAIRRGSTHVRRPTRLQRVPPAQLDDGAPLAALFNSRRRFLEKTQVRRLPLSRLAVRLRVSRFWEVTSNQGGAVAMRNADLFRTLSGGRFYRTYFEVRQAGGKEAGPAPARSPDRPSPDSMAVQTARNRIFKRYGLILGSMVLGSLTAVVAAMWLAYPAVGKACLLSLPPMLACAASWMAGAWWGSDKHPRVLIAVTLGLIPLRVLMVLGWAWLVLAIPEMTVEAFFLALMFHWILFACAEIGMLVEMSRLGSAGKRDDCQRWSPKASGWRYRIDRLPPEEGASLGAARHDLAPVVSATDREWVAGVR